MEIDELRRRVAGEEFDYQMVMDVLRGYARPRAKIGAWLKSNTLLRVKKGLYVFGESLARRPYSREVLANLIYGPSYISMEYALHYYGLTPERVETVTSCTVGRGRSFATPVGNFLYRQVPTAVYALGVDRIELDNGRSFLMAVPEKALADKLQSDRGMSIASPAELKTYLLDHMRVDPGSLRKMKKTLVSRIARAYASRRLRWLSELI